MKEILFLSLICFSLCSNVSRSCTTFTIKTDDELVFGRNYDFNIGYGLVFINKKGVIKNAMTSQQPAAEWISKYGSVTFNQFGREFPTGGINEAGLVVELMWLDDTKYPAKDERPAIGGVLQWIQYQLDNCETIQEVIDTDKLIRMPTAGVPIHFLITDKYGNSAVIEFLDGKLVQHSGDDMKYKVLTNDTYDRSLNYLKSIKEFGGENEMPLVKGSLERFAQSCSMVNNYKTQPGQNAVDYGFKILDEMKQGDATKWSIVYDIKNMQIYFKTFDDQKIKNIDLASIDYNCITPVRMLDINAEAEGNVNEKFNEYNYAANRKLIEDSYSGVDFLKSIPDESKDRAAAYPDGLMCRSKSSIESIDKIETDKVKSGELYYFGALVLISTVVTGFSLKKGILKNR
ncbi:MAG: linear amide C-N hydrolase [bacterium]